MSEKLIVRNFGPIVDFDLDIKKTIVFIGPQSSGKSTVAKLLAIFRSLAIVVNEKEADSFFEDYNIAKYFQDSSYLEYSNSDYKVIWENKKLSVVKTPAFKSEIETEKARIHKLVNTVVEERYKSDTEEEREKVRKQIFDYNFPFLFTLLKTQIYIPAERILASLISESGFAFNAVPLPGSLKEFGKEFENTRIRIKELAIPSLNITYKYEDKGVEKGARIYYDNTHSISLSESSSGIQSVVPMQVVIENLARKTEQKYSFIVEEPELNLFPTTQKAIVDYLIQKCNHRNELVITTHSPYVLSVLNNFIFAFIVSEKNKVSNTLDENEIKKIISMESWIDHNNFNAYYLSDGKAKCIVNPKTNLIYDNELDRVSQDIIGERDSLIELYKTVR